MDSQDPHAAGDRAASPGLYTAKHKSCDACKARKVKCPNANFPNPCANCIRRKTTCRFGIKRVPRRNVSGRTPAPHSPGTSPLRYVDLPQPGTPAGPDDDAAAAAHGALYSVAAAHDGARAAIPMLYIDHMLAHAQDQNLGKAYTPLTKGNGIFGGSYSLTFFSESRLLSLSSRLRNNRVNELVHRINGVISGRLRRTESAAHESVMLPAVPPRATTAALAASSAEPASSAGGGGGAAAGDSSPGDVPPPIVDAPFAAACIRCYFENLHPQFPFLDRDAFERRAADPDLARSLAGSRAWSALYHAVLALGCPYAFDTAAAMAAPDSGGDDDPSFEPGKGTAWRLFSVALGHFSALLILPDSLITLQALTAMAIYGLGVACLSIERVLLSEAARRAQSLAAAGAGGLSAPASTSATFQRTFWVLYGVEKVMSFHYGRSSSFADGDISCPLPAIPATPLGDGEGEDAEGHDGGGQTTTTTTTASNKTLDWFLLWIRHARLLSRTYTWLFSVGTSCNSAASSLATINQLAAEVEAWRLSIPDVCGLRPQQAGPPGGLGLGPVGFGGVGGGGGGGGDASSTAGGTDAGASDAGTGPSPGVVQQHQQQTTTTTATTATTTGTTATTVHRRKRLHHHHHHHVHAHASRTGGGPQSFEQITALRLSFLYHSYMLILARARLRHLARLAAESPQALPPDAHRLQQAASEQVITSSCRAILELTPAIAVEPYTPLWILAVAPLSSLLVLFDFVVHHPAAPDAAAHLVLLDMGAGYFSRIEYTSGGTLPGSLVSEFAHIARDYVHGRQRQDTAMYGGGGVGGGGEVEQMQQQQQQQQQQTQTQMQQQTQMQAQQQQQQQAQQAHAQQAQQQAQLQAQVQQQQQQQQIQTPLQQQPLPLLPTQLLSPSSALAVPTLPQLSPSSFVDASALAPVTGPTAMDWSAAAGVPGALGGGAGGGAGDPLGYGYGFGGPDAGAGDFAGTDVLGLFSYLLPDMDSMLYPGMGDAGM